MEDKSKSSKLNVFVEFGAFKQLPKDVLSVFAKEKNSMLKLLLRTPPYNESLELEIGGKELLVLSSSILF